MGPSATLAFPRPNEVAEPDGARKRLRLLFVTPRYWPAVGGISAFVRHVTTEIARRHEVAVLAQRTDDAPRTRLSDSLRPPPPFEPFADGDARVEPLELSVARRARLAPLVLQVTPGIRRYAHGRMRHSTNAMFASAVAPLIARRAVGVDVIHMWGGDQLAAAAVRAARGAGVPLVITPFAHGGSWGDDPVSGSTYRAADRVLGLLNEDAAVYRALGVPERNVGVSGVCSPGVRGGGGEALRARHGIAGPLVLFLGVRRPYKGHELLLEAAGRVAATRSDVTFAFAGPGDALTAVPDGVRVIDVGSVDEDERADWLDAADLLCLPSKGEIFPVSILEAWSVGTPVLTSDLPTLRELIGRSRGGEYVRREPGPLAERLLELLSQPQRLLSLGEAGRAFWQAGHTVEAVADWHEKVYMDLAAA